MSVFGNILDKIFHRDPGKIEASPIQPNGPGAAPDGASVNAHTPAADVAAPDTTLPPPPAAQTGGNTDVGLVLAAMAEMKADRGGNYKTSIVDLLKLLDLDAGLAARKELAQELEVRAGADGSAQQNIALHRAVMARLAENGGLVPDDLRS